MGSDTIYASRQPVYTCADAAALAALANMQDGDLCLQQDTNVWYFYTGSAWQQVAESGYTLITALDLGSSGIIDFTSISSVFKAFKVILHVSSDRGSADSMNMNFNNDTGAKYDDQSLNGNGGNATATTVANATAHNFAGLEGTAALFSGYTFTIMETDGTSGTNTSMKGGQITQAIMHFCEFTDTTAISRITFQPNVGTNFRTGSKAYLLGLK